MHPLFDLDLMAPENQPDNFVTNTGKTFDYVNYLRKDGIFFIIKNAQIEITDAGGGNRIKSTF